MRRTIPGCQSFEPTGDNSFAATLQVSVGPVRGDFSGTIRLEDIHQPESYIMIIEGQGPTGFVHGTGLVALSEERGKTLVKISGDAQVGGTIAQIGSRMIESAARVVVNQFFGALEAEIQRLSPP